MVTAFFARNASYDGVFFTGVATTGIFCRPVCPAKKPRLEHIEFFASPRDALFSGYRPCKRCRPMEPTGSPPSWLSGLLDELEEDPTRKWTDEDLRGRGLHPDRVRRWFQKHHGMTFHSYGRARRLGLALGKIREGSGVSTAAFGHGYESLSGFNEAFRQVLGSAPRDVRAEIVLTVGRVLTPLGPMIAGATESALYVLEFADRRMLEAQIDRLRARLRCVLVPGSNEILEQIGAELQDYFDGHLREFRTPLASPGTVFQQAVWRELRLILYGETRSYADVARAIGRPTAVRAVARANGDNRLAILVPCHRVIGSNGRLTGYGGGLWRKKRLLELESRHMPGELFRSA
jgi:AraC family transcriptional regulator of adaptative response/methylated-DNA-[protein]-cysteine methyltransferase